MHKRGTSSAPLIDGILNSLPGKLCDEKSIDLERFITLYYDQIPDTDLSTATPEDFGGAAISHWQLLQKRKPGEALVKIFNPQLDQHGWQCAHTVIEIVFDDMPLLVNSVSMAVLEKNINIHLTVHPIFNIVRDKDHRIINLPDDQGCPADANASREAVIHMQIDRQADKNQIEQLTRYVDKTLFRVAAINQDKPELEQQVAKLAALLSSAGQPTSDIAHGAGEKSRALANAPSDARLQSSNLLEWLDERHYSVFGSASYQLEDDGNHLQKTNTGLGLLRDTDRHHALTIEETLLAEITAFSWESASEPSLVITKSNCRSPISRPEALDMLLVFHGQPDARQVDVLIGLFTEQMISRETTDVPILREKVSRIIERSGLPQDSHDCKALKSTLEGLPRDILFQAGSDTVLEIASGIINLQERQRIRLFGTQAPNGTYYNCLAFVPRDSYGRKLRLNIESILLNELKGVRSEFSSSFSSQSTLARLHYVIQTGTSANAQASSDRPDWNHIEERIIQAAIGWDDRLHAALLSKHDENRANDFFSRYRDAFPASYKEDYSARIACSDIEFIERHVTPDFPVMSFYRHIMTDVGTVNFKLFSPQGYIALSDVIPIIENMGLRVDAEHPFQINRKNNFPVWIHEFTVQHIDGMEIDPEASSDNIQQAFSQIWRGAVENDGFNRLIIEADLNWRQIIILRSYCKYLLQIQSPFSQDYMIRSLVNNPSITRSLVTLFENRFDPTLDRRTADKSDEIVAQLETELAQVESLDEDRILRAYVNLVNATVRTNYFCSNPQGQPLPYVSYKLDSQSIEQLPLPHPKYEIFVYSPKVEGIHLRGGKVARGGLRWSDRREDFRTEVLGLMKAQMVKNAVIVPVGSKGGFFVKQPPAITDREAYVAEGTACYKTFLRGLLDLTDNLNDDLVEPPADVVRHDADDPYLVVAADKGTATFSDHANEVAQSYGYWLGDAFASGGSVGYDHKKMGITAKGAWESVKRHFRELGTNTQTSAFSVVGIGDMAGDVFGNGMLLSKEINLLAAFNHQHIFIDPNPDAEQSFNERQRLFNLPRSNWKDYDESLISTGGGIYSRSSKKIQPSADACKALDIEHRDYTPDELIHQLLMAKVDLLWNGGIGTYIKSATETHSDVSDRANDSLRVNGGDLRCRVVGEGGNLGCTQLGRIEFSRQGGKIYTDAIDNSAGVDCSDHEVNIKILLNSIEKNGDMTTKQRDQLLAEMTSEVGQLVLRDNYLQTQCISLTSADAASALSEHARFMTSLESAQLLDRDIEYLPSVEAIADRMANETGLLAPEIAVLVSYSKMTLYDWLLDSALPEEAYLEKVLIDYFPARLGKQFRSQIQTHRLRREIIATSVTNELVNRMGPTFVSRMQEEIGASPADVARSFVAVCAIFEMPRVWSSIEALDNTVPADIQTSMHVLVRGLVERSIHWMLRSRRESQSIEDLIAYFQPGVSELIASMPECLASGNRTTLNERCDYFVNSGVSSSVAQSVAQVVPLSSALDIVEIAKSLNSETDTVASVYYDLGTFLDLQWLRDEIAQLDVRTHWHTLAKSELRSDLHYQHRYLCAEVLRTTAADPDPRKSVQAWADNNESAVSKYRDLVFDMKASSSMDFAMLSLAVNEVHKLLSSDRPLG